MSTTKYIKKIALPMLNHYDFQYRGAVTGSIWNFERERNNVLQNIAFIKSNLFNGLRIEFQTSNRRGKAPVGSNILMSSEEYWCEFNDENTLEEVILKLCNVAINNLETLDLLSLPIIQPTPDMFSKLIKSPTDKATYTKNKYGLLLENPSESLVKLMNTIQEKASQSEEESSDLIICFAAFLGELIILELGGTWIWEEEIKLSYIANVGEVGLEVSPLHWITDYWGGPKLTINNLIFRFESLKKSYLNRKES